MTDTITPSDLKPNTLWRTGDGELVKVSTISDTLVSAQLLYPLRTRTTVYFYNADEVAQWSEPSAQLIGRYERAWGFDGRG